MGRGVGGWVEVWVCVNVVIFISLYKLYNNWRLFA